MHPRLQQAVEELVHQATGKIATVVAQRPATGGCIHEAYLLELADGRSLFVKTNSAPLPGLFEREREGLEALDATETIRVPQPLGVGGGDGIAPFLVLEAIETGPPGPGFFADFGRRFAALHRAAAPRGPNGESYGFPHDNYLGSTPQKNSWQADVCELWRQHRIGYQLELARQKGRSNAELDRLGDRLLDRLDQWLGDLDEPASLLHGDLWSGNYLVSASGEPVLIDPAAYCGPREADLAMTRLFGGFERSFYEAYESSWPLPPGAAERLQIFELYHLLNHLNLFGGSYRGSCLAILRRLV